MTGAATKADRRVQSAVLAPHTPRLGVTQSHGHALTAALLTPCRDHIGRRIRRLRRQQIINLAGNDVEAASPRERRHDTWDDWDSLDSQGDWPEEG
jgi:hypothetical protein